jgi:nitrite reductase/ring-hydroxylating ferredoxin subunit
MSSRVQLPPFGGYYAEHGGESNRLLTEVGPRTPAGEYFRRFWHPVAIAGDLGNRPLRVRVLGEDLVLFRRPDGELGLLHLHCLHRRASLEWGQIEPAGLRCCYHGWLYGIDGRVLETPLEPEGSKMRERLCLGAYPVHEMWGLIFAYMGPPEAMPEFPVYDSLSLEGDILVPYPHRYPCNWLQVAENSMDHDHVVYLHTPKVGDPQFYASWGIPPVLVYRQFDFGVHYTYSRRVDDKIWMGMEDIYLPNFTQAGSVFTMDGSKPRYFGRNAFTRWVVPHDDENTTVFMIAHFNDRADPFRPEYTREPNLQRLESGTTQDRPYDERQRNPGDFETIVGLGPINLHSRENLSATDRGVALYRRMLTRAITSLRDGVAPIQHTSKSARPIPTNGGDNVLSIPQRAGGDDRELVKEVSARVLDIYENSETLVGAERDAFVVRKLKDLEVEFARSGSTTKADEVSAAEE